LILFADEHLLVVNKPAGVNTHRPDHFAPEGLHEWLSRRHGELSVLHRLDKETSGVILFGRSRQANQSLAQQFLTHKVRKEYLLLSDRRPSRQRFIAKSPNMRTEFDFVADHGKLFLVRAQPITGKTHQIRRHAAENHFPILGDSEYEGTPAPRMMLHAHRLTFAHPVTGATVTFTAPVPSAFEEPTAIHAARDMRDLLFGEETTAYRLISGAADGYRDLIVDSYGGRLFAQWQTEAVDAALYDKLPATAIYEQISTKQRRTAPQCVRGVAEERFAVRENGLTFLIGFGEGLSTGLFMDQRENRLHLLNMDLRGRTLLNTFSYTCAFSVAAARAGARTTSVDLSKKYLEWGKENFRANNLDPAGHEFFAGDVFEWFKLLAKRGRQWDFVIVDPPTFSTTKAGRAFQAERDYAELATQAVALVAKGGTLFCSTNQRTLAPGKFAAMMEQAAQNCGRNVRAIIPQTLPFDFRLAEGEQAYLKTLWADLD